MPDRILACERGLMPMSLRPALKCSRSSRETSRMFIFCVAAPSCQTTRHSIWTTAVHKFTNITIGLRRVEKNSSVSSTFSLRSYFDKFYSGRKLYELFDQFGEGVVQRYRSRRNECDHRRGIPKEFCRSGGNGVGKPRPNSGPLCPHNTHR